MSIIYDENKKPSGPSAIPYHSLPATRYWHTHFENSCYLRFIAEKSDDPAERRQANSELIIANKKMDYWKRHPNWDTAGAARLAETTKQKWKG